jgi:pyruvate dehydrogenase E2 component (dihydrolipoamide acetyltransferase)
MIELVRLPHLGKVVNQGIFTRWLKVTGEPVETGEPLYEVTADKVTLEVEAPAGGTLLHCSAHPGQLVPADGIVGVIGPAEANIPPEAAEARYPVAPAECALRFRSALDAHGTECPAQPLSPMRTVVAERMRQSKAEAPHFYVQSVVDMTGCMELRKRLKREERVRVTYNDMIIKACAEALKSYPQVAAVADPAGYLYPKDIALGFAVAVEPDGLVVPVVRCCGQLSLPDLAAETRSLAERARKNRLLPEEAAGSVFTVSNLGGFGVDNFTAIINPGESAILAVGAVIDTPVAFDGTVAIRPMMRITLSSDHRVIDGVLAAKFTRTVKKLLESPSDLMEPSSSASG